VDISDIRTALQLALRATVEARGEHEGEQIRTLLNGIEEVITETIDLIDDWAIADLKKLMG
jgi:hypothetical protein